jgi:hypothetical protein
LPAPARINRQDVSSFSVGCVDPGFAMTTTLVRDNLHRDLLRDCIGVRFSEPDALLCMMVLHTHEITMKPGTATSGNGRPLTVIPAITQRHAAEVVAALWAEGHPDDSLRSSYAYWYHQYNNRPTHELFSDVPESLLPRLIELRDALARDPRVAAIAAEE